MGAIAASGTGAGQRVLADIVGAQVAWWNLGFAVRRAVVREARRGKRFPEPDVWDVSARWARQWLAAPWWWRLVRSAGVTVLVVVGLTGLAAVLGEVDGITALSGAVAGCLPPAAGWSWRQARIARLFAAQDLDPAPDPLPARRLAVRTVLVLLAVGAAVSATIIAIANDRSARYDCPEYAVDAPVHDWWLHRGGRAGVGCPAADTRSAGAGVRYTPWSPVVANRFGWSEVVYAFPPEEPITMFAPIFGAWIAAGGPSGVLGRPTDGNVDDTTTAYVNFRGGTIVLTADGDPKVHVGQQYARRARDLASPCAARDRPCITTAYADAGGIHVGWQYGAADAFNVTWQPAGGPPWSERHREVAGFEVTLPDVRPATTYLVSIQACEKHFLSRSACTWPPDEVAVRVG
ncbi:hypothetical protein [Amycolatopsis sp. NPDC003861]